MRVVVALALVLTSVVLTPARQQSAAASPGAKQAAGSIAGVVVDADTGAPVAGAIVTVHKGGPTLGGQNSILTDGEGRFVLTGLTAGSHFVSASKFGRTGSYGQRRPTAATRAIVLSAGQAVAGISIALWSASTIGGHVTDNRGLPLAGVTVDAFSYASVSEVGETAALVRATTDDFGAYTLTMPRAGSYIVGVAVSHNTIDLGANAFSRDAGLWVLRGPTDPDGRHEIDLEGVPLPPAGPGAVSLTYVTTFAPAALSPTAASVVRVETGEEIAGVDISMTPVRAVRLAGVVAPAPDNSSVVTLTLCRDEALRRLNLIDAQASTTNGEFVMMDVPEGTAVLEASQQPATGNGLHDPAGMWARLPIVAGPASEPLSVVMRPGVTISGRIEFDGDPAGEAARVQLMIDSRPGSISIGPDNSFAATGIHPGKYFPTAAASTPSSIWYLQSITARGRNVVDEPLDVTGDINDVVIRFSRRDTGIAGVVTGTPEAVAESTVVLFPADPALWGVERGSRSIRQLQPDADGHFVIRSLSPGEYLVAAIDAAQSDEWRLPPAIGAIAARAVRVSLQPGTTARVSLRADR